MNASERPGADAAAQVALNSFLRRYAEDRQAGAVRSAEEYAALFPGHEELIRGELSCLAALRSTEDGGTFGDYRLLEFLGSGGFGQVHRALDLRLGRQVALKILNTINRSDDEHLRRFDREAKIAARLDHPGICAVYETGFVGDVPYIAMR